MPIYYDPLSGICIRNIWLRKLIHRSFCRKFHDWLSRNIWSREDGFGLDSLWLWVCNPECLQSWVFTFLVCTLAHVLTRNLFWQVMILENQTINRQLSPWTSVTLLKPLRLAVWCQRPPREMQMQMNPLRRFHLFQHLDLQETMHHISTPSIANLWWLSFPFWLLFLHEAFICPLYNIELC